MHIDTLLSTACRPRCPAAHQLAGWPLQMVISLEDSAFHGRLPLEDSPFHFEASLSNYRTEKRLVTTRTNSNGHEGGYRLVVCMRSDPHGAIGPFEALHECWRITELGGQHALPQAGSQAGQL